MAYSIEALLFAFPEGLTLKQLKSMIREAGFQITNKDLMTQLGLLPNIEKCGKCFKKMSGQDQEEEKLMIATKDLIKSLKQFIVASQGKRSYKTQLETNSSEDDSESEDSTDEDQMPRKFWEKKPQVITNQRDVKVLSKQY